MVNSKFTVKFFVFTVSNNLLFVAHGMFTGLEAFSAIYRLDETRIEHVPFSGKSKVLNIIVSTSVRHL